MIQRILAVIMVIICIAMVGIFGFIRITSDRIPPKITMSEDEVIFTETEEREGDYSALLAAVTAKDNKDGDLTDQVFVEKVISNEESGQAIVYYGVVDEANNVGTANRFVTYVTEEEMAKEAMAETAEADVEAEDEDADTDDTAVTDGEDADETDEEYDAEAPKSKEEMKEELAEGLKTSGKRPVIVLKQDTVRISKGDSFSPLEYVGLVGDDQDSLEELGGRIDVDGSYNTKKVGEYEVIYSVVDSDKHTSDTKVLTLIVE